MILTIDAKRCDLPEGRIVVPGFDARDLSDPQRCRTGRSLRLQLPATARNDRVLGFARDPHAAARFDAELHRARLTEEDAVLLEGTVRLLATTDGEYTVEIRAGGGEWAERMARAPFEQIPVEYAARLTAETIRASWSGPSPVRFLPVHRDAYPAPNGSADLLAACRPLSTDDYHPFLHLATLAERAVSAAGYTLESAFFRTEFFRSLHMSGAYASRDTAALRRHADFRAGRLTRATAAADALGRVYANPFLEVHSVGNLVESAVPDPAGTTADLYDNGRCFGIEQGRIRFRPAAALEAGFDCELHYVTAHRILTRERLQGFDGVMLGPGCDVRFALPNRYADRRGALTAGYAYRAVVFDHAEGARYRLVFTRDGVPDTAWTAFSARTAAVSTPAAGRFADPRLLIERGGAWVPYDGDWALYDGYVEETGTTAVTLRVHTPAETVTPGSPKRFDTVYFYGAAEGMELTLLETCRLQPRFSASPGYGAPVTFARTAQHGVRQLVLFEALQHLFNLRFLADERQRRLIVEPADDFYDRTHVVDWSGRTDFAQPVVRTPLAPEQHELRTWDYLAGDGAVRRHDADHPEAPFGRWSVRTGGYAALQGEQRLTNPLFAATLDAAGSCASAPSALLPQVGDRDDASADDARFTPRIVRYCGLCPLPRGERWGWPSDGTSYPLAAFHHAGDAAHEGFTLCFEDRDGQQGLHRFRDRQVAQERLRERIELSLRLEPRDFEALLRPEALSDGGACIRSVFRLDLGGACVLATLHRIAGYDPRAASTRCLFIRLPEQ